MGASGSVDTGFSADDVSYSTSMYHGDNYTENSGGLYEIGYEQGFEDSATQSTSDNPVDYVAACTPSGNQGYVDGVADGGNFGTK